MSFRNPLYLDSNLMVPLANYHDIQVMTDVAITRRDLGGRDFGGKVGLPSNPIATFEAQGSKSRQSETTQAQTLTDHPVSALNRLVDKLESDGSLRSIGGEPISRHDSVSIEADWELSQISDLGAIFSALFGAVRNDPKIIDENRVPLELLTTFLGSDPASGPAVLQSEIPDGTMVFALIERENIVGNTTADDLEGNLVVLGQVEKLIAADQSYSLERFMMPGVSRAMRRAMASGSSIDKMLEGASKIGNREMSRADLEVSGPAVVVRTVAIY